MDKRIKLTGVVFSDLGQAASFMALEWVQRALRERIGFSPYPATLNVRLESEDQMAVWREVQRQVKSIQVTPPDSSFCQARCFLVEIQGLAALPAQAGGRQGKQKGAVLLPEVEGYPADKVEVIAPVRLKDELRVQDGDRITLEFKG